MSATATNAVDVIIPCYRYGRFLRECVRSVLSQNDVQVRVLIIDDASPDDSGSVAEALAEEDSRVIAICHKLNKGHIETYNEGIEWASSDYMLILSADDRSAPGALGRAVRFMEVNPEVVLTFGDVLELRDGEEVIVQNALRPPSEGIWRTLNGQEFIEASGGSVLLETCTAVVRTSVQKSVGGYRPNLPHAGDMEMWLRFAAHGSVGVVSACQGVYRRHGANMSSACYYYARDGSFVYTTNGRLVDLEQRRLALVSFFDDCRSILPDPSTLERRLFHSLALIAVQRASAAFNEGDLDGSAQIANFARDVDPLIEETTTWRRFNFKRKIGFRAWRAVQPAFAAMRGAPVSGR